MELREMIEKAAEKIGSQKELAKLINQHSNSLTSVKAGIRGIPVSACIKLAEILEIDAIHVIVASEMINEKDEDKRKILAPFVLDLPRKVASWTIGIATAATIGITAPKESYANTSDILNMSSTPYKANQILNDSIVYCVLCKIRKTYTNIIRTALGKLTTWLPRFGFSGS